MLIDPCTRTKRELQLIKELELTLICTLEAHLHENKAQDFYIWLKHAHTKSHSIALLIENESGEGLEDHIAGFEEQI